MIRSRRKTNNGLSLIEILVAYGILAVAVLGLLGGLPAAARQQRASIKMNQALYLAEAKMDSILTSESKIATTSLTDQPMGDDSMIREWYGTTMIGNTDLQLITVKVSWLENGRTRQVVLRSYLNT